HVVQEGDAVHGVEPVELHAGGGAVGLQAVDEALHIGQVGPGGGAGGEQHVGGLETGGSEGGVVGGGEGLAQVGAGHTGHHGGGLRTGQAVIGSEGAPVVHAGEDARVVEAQHRLVLGVGQGGDGVDGGEHLLGHHSGQDGNKLMTG